MDHQRPVRQAYWRNALRTFARAQTRGSQSGEVPWYLWPLVVLIGLIIFVAVPRSLQPIGMAIVASLVMLFLHISHLRRLQKLHVDLQVTLLWRLRWYYYARLLLVTPILGFAMFNPRWFFVYVPLYLGLRKLVERPNWKRRTILLLRRFGEDSTDIFGKLIFPIAHNFGYCVTLAERELRSPFSRLAVQWSPLGYIGVEDSQWQKVVLDYFETADVIILDYRGRSPALEWEFQTALARCRNRLLVIRNESDRGDEPHDGTEPETIYFQECDVVTFQSSLGESLSNILRRHSRSR